MSGGAGEGTVLDVLLADQHDDMTPLRCLKCARPSKCHAAGGLSSFSAPVRQTTRGRR